MVILPVIMCSIFAYAFFKYQATTIHQLYEVDSGELLDNFYSPVVLMGRMTENIYNEMKEVAHYFGKEVLREVDEDEFYANIANLRTALNNDRAILRAIHFFNENRRVNTIVERLNKDDFEGFKTLIQESGNSSYKFLQNVYADFDYKNQAVSLGLAMSEMILKDHGVCRVHGGGFAGTIQAFVENSYVETYKEEIEKVFGKGSCHILKVRKLGGCKVID